MKKFYVLAKILFLFFAIASFSLLIVSCNDDEDEKENTISSDINKLSNRTWHLVRYVERNVEYFPTYTENDENYKTKLYNITFYKNATIRWTGRVNDFDAIYAITDKDNIVIHTYLQTLLYDMTGADDKMMAAIESVCHYKISGKKLFLYYSGNDSKYMEFKDITNKNK